MSRIILWFKNNLRLRDNDMIYTAMHRIKSRKSIEVIPWYCFDPRVFDCGILDYKKKWIGQPKIGIQRANFILDSVKELKCNLKKINSDLLITIGKPEDIIQKYIVDNNTYIYVEKEITYEEIKRQKLFMKKIKNRAQIIFFWQSTLYHEKDLELKIFMNYIKFDTEDKFKILLEHSDAKIRKEYDAPQTGDLPLPSLLLFDTKELLSLKDLPFHFIIKEYIINTEFKNHKIIFKGGETNGLKRLNDYMNYKIYEIESYKEDVGNEYNLKDSSYLAPWISLGCLSAKTIYYTSKRDKKLHNILYQSLLKRDWCKYLGYIHGFRIFSQGGLKGLPTARGKKRYKYKYDNEKFKRWREGNTGIPIIDACMRQLNTTGYINHNCRKICASYFTNDMNHDWRIGADYFESKLIDYDPCINWVMWMEIANLIIKRVTYDNECSLFHFSKCFDPNGTFIKYWIPALNDLPSLYIHEPWRLNWHELLKYNINYGKTYPTPIRDKYFV